jgi:hypothetical protein
VGVGAARKIRGIYENPKSKEISKFNPQPSNRVLARIAPGARRSRRFNVQKS